MLLAHKHSLTGAQAITITDVSGTSVVSLEAGGLSVFVGGTTMAVSQLAGLHTVTAAVDAQPTSGLLLSIEGRGSSISYVGGNVTGSGGDHSLAQILQHLV